MEGILVVKKVRKKKDQLCGSDRNIDKGETSPFKFTVK